MSEPSSPSSTLRQKLKSTLCLSFRKQHSSAVDDHKPSPSLSRSSSTCTSPKAAWIKSRASEIPELKDKCVSFISRIGKQSGAHNHHHNNNHHHNHHHYSRGRSGHHRRHSLSADFRYDPLSYSLNFDEGLDENQDDEFPLRSFSSRLPPSPTREIDCRS